MVDVEVEEAAGPLSSDARDALREVCERAETEVRGLLPGLPGDIVLRVKTGGHVIPEIGLGARAWAPGEIHCDIDTSRPEGPEWIVRTHLRPALFHEFHHLVRGWVITGGEPRTEFIDPVICEGLGTAFERDEAGSDPPWGRYPDNVRDWVDELLALPASANYVEWMFQHPDGRQWIGYRAGTFIVDEAIKRSGRSAADLVVTPYQEILEFAGYERSTDA